MSENVQPNDPNARVCKICGNEFYGFLFDTRIFCYNCSPRGATVAKAKRTQKRVIKHLLVKYKGGKCVECGYKKCEGALQFHHIDGQDKDFVLSTINPNSIPMSDMYKEVDKCILLCANCHAKKHEVTDKIATIMHLPMQNNNFGTKKCVVCTSEFVANRPHRSYCYTCSPEGLNAKDAMRMKKRAIKRALLDYKGGAVCSSCGYDEYDGALQLHHRNPEDKEFTFSRTPLNEEDCTMERLKKEADKCDVLCANCHAEIHYMDDDFDFD
jgi:5-methylcytosine-specific restriction endonuclease McrA